MELNKDFWDGYIYREVEEMSWEHQKEAFSTSAANNYLVLHYVKGYEYDKIIHETPIPIQIISYPIYGSTEIHFDGKHGNKKDMDKFARQLCEALDDIAAINPDTYHEQDDRY